MQIHRGFLILLAVAAAGWCQAQNHPRQSPDQQLAEERYKRLNSSLEELWAARAAIDARIDALAAEIRRLREEQGRPKTDHATTADLKLLADKIKEIDDKRIEDNKRILEEIKKLGATAKATAASAPRAVSADRGYEHTVAKGDTISTIAAAYKSEGIPVTVDAILRANPGLDPKRLQIGQVIWIPAH